MLILVAAGLFALNTSVALPWWGGTLEEVSKRDIIKIASALGYKAEDVNSSDTRVQITAPELRFVSYLSDCRMKSGEYLEQCSKIRVVACWDLSEFGFNNPVTATVAVFANEYNRLSSPARKFDTVYAFVPTGGKAVCLASGFYLNDGVSSQYIGANMRAFVRAAVEFKQFASEWR